MQSFLTGAAMALVLGSVGLVVASLTIDPPVTPDAVAAPVATMPADEDAQFDAVETLPAPEPEPEPVAEPEPDSLADLVIVPAFDFELEPEPDAQPAPDTAQSDPSAIAMPEPEPEVKPEPAPQAPAVRINRPAAAPLSDLPEEVVADLTPLTRYAAQVDYPADLPLVAVILLDDPTHADAPALIAALPFVPSVVLDAGSADVTARMRAYRALGVEVLVAAPLPQGAQPSDVEITFQAAFNAVPEAVAVFADSDQPASGTVAVQVQQLIAAEGRGYVNMPRGLGAMRPAGAVPTTQITRDVDGADEPQAEVERNLAQVAFRARQTGSGVLLARATPATLEAVRIWSNRSDPGQVSLVPVSAMLISQLPPP